MERKQYGEALRQHAQKGHAQPTGFATDWVATYSKGGRSLLTGGSGAEVFYNQRKQEELTETSPMLPSSRRGISGDMVVGRRMGQLEKPSLPGEETSPQRCRL